MDPFISCYYKAQAKSSQVKCIYRAQQQLGQSAVQMDIKKTDLNSAGVFFCRFADSSLYKCPNIYAVRSSVVLNIYGLGPSDEQIQFVMLFALY